VPNYHDSAKTTFFWNEMKYVVSFVERDMLLEICNIVLDETCNSVGKKLKSVISVTY